MNDGAAVRVSLICFGNATGARLNGDEVGAIHADLTAGNADGTTADLSAAKRFPGSGSSAFEGLRKDGPLDISGQQAREWLRLPNPHGKSNALVLFPLINGIDVTRRPRDGWVIDTGESLSEADASLFEAPFAHIERNVKPVRLENNDRIRRTYWWRFGRNGEQLRAAIKPLLRYINTARVSKYRLFVWQANPCIPDTATVAIARADDTTFGILHSRFHELWSLRMGTSLEDRPRYTPTTCFETFPFPAGLTPRDTAHQRTELLEGGAVIPADLDADNSESNVPIAPVEHAQAAIKTGANSASTSISTAPPQSRKARPGRVSGAILKSAAYEPPAPAPALPSERKNAAIHIATAAHRLNALRENWLNPPEWTERVPEVTPLGMDTSPYPDRILPKNGHEKDLAERTLTKLYNQRPAWLDAAHKALDAAVARAYGWSDYTAEMPDEEILKRLLALNLERAARCANNGD